MADKYVTVGGELMKVIDRIAELITLDGVNLTPAGEKFAAWLETEIDGLINNIPPQVEALRKPPRAVNGMKPPPDRTKEKQAQELERLQAMLMDYRGMVLASQSFTPALYFKTFPDDAWEMWGVYSSAMQQQTTPAPEQATESQNGEPMLFTEALDLTEARVDHANRVIKNVVLIRAGMSKNRRHYAESVLQKAVPVFAHTRAFDGHKSGERSVSELTGYYENVRYEGGKLVGDRHFLDTQAGRDVWAVASAIAEGKAPRSLAGLSINATGTGKTKRFTDGDALDVESISEAYSVDDVLTPAAAGAYLESHQPVTPAQPVILVEGYRLTPQGETLMKFLSGHIINTSPGLSYYQEVQRLKMTRAVDWMRQNPGAARSLWEVYIAYVKQELTGINENQQFAEELKASIGTKPALVKGRDLTTDGKALVAWLERVNPQTIHALRYQTYTRSGSTSPAEFMRIFEGGAQQLWDDMCRDVSARAEKLAQEAVETARAVGLTG